MIEDNYLQRGDIKDIPRLPLGGSIDFTYRCNNNCRHCWLRIPIGSKLIDNELTFGQIRKIIYEAKKSGCRRWSISGGEPMLRQDFCEIFEYLTSNCNHYSINTNGTLITPAIARLMRRKGTKLVALCGATARVHDFVTRTPGSFEATIRGLRYLKEAGAGFAVQLIPMKDNYHQFKEMLALAQSLSRHYRVGASWLYLSADGDRKKNSQIMRQRLAPEEVVKVDRPVFPYGDGEPKGVTDQDCHNASGNGYFFSSCINLKRSFHIDPYGKMSFCSFVKYPPLRYDLKKGSFRECWEEFIPSLARKVKASSKYMENCGSCSLRQDCKICPVYAYLEHRNFNARIEYLCSIAKENRRSKENWSRSHQRYFNIAGMTVRIDSDLPITDSTFGSKFKSFEAKGTDNCDILIRHHFFLPELAGKSLGREFYRKAPWAIYKKNDSWIYLGILPGRKDRALDRIAVFNSSHTRARIYNADEGLFVKGGLQSLTMFPTDQILLARVLADRGGCLLHSCGVDLKGRGLLFIGRSEAGKSTMATMLKDEAKILCDDRIIIRDSSEEIRIYGTWSHGDVPDVSASSVPLRAILFLKKSKRNSLSPLDDKKEIIGRILACLVRPLVTSDWLEKTLLFLDRIIRGVPCYVMEFDKSGEILRKLRKL